MGILGDQDNFARDLKITVVSRAGGGCRGNHYVGQTFYVVDALTPKGICINAWSAMLPSINVLMFQGRMPWGCVDKMRVACPDGENQTIFEIVAIDEKNAGKERAEMMKRLEKSARRPGAGKFKGDRPGRKSGGGGPESEEVK